jgi:hypothetical protein
VDKNVRSSNVFFMASGEEGGTTFWGAGFWGLNSSLLLLCCAVLFLPTLRLGLTGSDNESL